MILEDYLPEDVVKIGSKFFINSLNSKQDNFNYIYSGIFLGEIDSKTNRFRPSLKFLDMIKDNFGEIVLNKRNSWLFSCNRLITDVIKDTGGRFVIVRTAHNEILGLALRQEKKFIPIYDLGYLLRKEMT